MFFADKPYVSDFFKKTVADHSIAVVGIENVREIDLLPGTSVLSEVEAISFARNTENLRCYATSENSIGWIARHLKFTGLPDAIALFKNKGKFRKLLHSMYPNFKFVELTLDDLRTFSIGDFPLPFIIKPTVGFFSMGVHMVSSVDEWDETVAKILAEMEQVKSVYPEEVLDTNSFIIEQFIEGEEFAIDAYFDAQGEPVVVSILKHVFSSENDVSDRVYITSREIIEDNLDDFTEFVGQIGKLSGVKNFPVHVELRRDKDGLILPIEVNPMRFGGWCTTADIMFLAFGINPYLLFYNQEKPHWENALKGKKGKIFSIIVLDNSTGRAVQDIPSFNYNKLLSKFEKPLELRKVDYQKYSVFGFLFVETRDSNFSELQSILESDLSEFIELCP